jgi:hypothetical protein
MNVKTWLSLSCGLMLAVAAPLPARSLAKKVDSNRFNSKMETVAVRANDISMKVGSLATQFLNQELDWQSYAGRLELAREDVNTAGKILAAYEQDRASLQPWQRQLMDRAFPLMQHIATKERDAIGILNANRTNLYFHQSFEKDLNSLQADSDQLVKVINESRDLNKVQAKARHLRAELRSTSKG